MSFRHLHSASVVQWRRSAAKWEMHGATKVWISNAPPYFLDTTSRVTSVRATRFMPLVYMTQLIPIC